MEKLKNYFKFIDYSFKICIIYYFVWMLFKVTIFNYSYDLYLFSLLPIYYLIGEIVFLMMIEIGYIIKENTEKESSFYLLIVVLSIINTLIIMKNIETYLGQVFSFLLVIIYLVLLIECKNYYNIIKKIRGETK